MSETRIPTEERAAAALQDLGERVEPARPFDIPAINYDRFGSLSPSIKSSCEDIISFLKTPYRYDRFDNDHAARRVWFEKTQKTFGSAAEPGLKEIGRNKFRNNIAMLATINIEEIDAFLTENGADAVLIQKLHPTSQQMESIALSLSHRDQTVEGRKVQLMHLEDLAIQFLRELAAWSQQPQK